MLSRMGLKHHPFLLTAPHTLNIVLCKTTIFIYKKEFFCLSLWTSPKWVNELSVPFDVAKKMPGSCSQGHLLLHGPVTAFSLHVPQSIQELYLLHYRFALQKDLINIYRRARMLGTHFWSLKCIHHISRTHDCGVSPAPTPSPRDTPGWKTHCFHKALPSPREALSKEVSSLTLILSKEVSCL